MALNFGIRKARNHAIDHRTSQRFRFTYVSIALTKFLNAKQGPIDDEDRI